ncbi:hypothetical protein CRG98_049692 [Punica granatum]|uniref:Uncharacterized protein n=1 Tax=Punica granatum TaxID=22663 RepID=A0A2I0H5H7_PUNGR|nr:hypothetical protein CRG98_049692 [Punica granatum]
MEGLISLAFCKHCNPNSATAVIIFLVSQFDSNPRLGSTSSCSAPVWILLTAMVEKLISCLCLVMSTAGKEDISSIRTTPKLYTSLFSVNW